MKSARARVGALLLVLTMIATGWNAARTAVVTAVIHSFNGASGGGDPAGAFAGDAAGDLYGTTVVGGADGCGTVFELPASRNATRTEKVLYNFTCGDDGKNPYGGVTFDESGFLFGTTAAGGSGGMCAGDGCGVVYELSPAGETVLHAFKGGKDGYGPGGGVVFDAFGHLYGTTPDGGADSEGTVYELSFSNSAWHERVIHAFTGGSDGAVGSLGSLLVDASGDLFGVTEEGGAHGAGVVFEMSPQAGGAWSYRTLYAFKGEPDAGFPYGGLIAGRDGNLFGTTYYGGAHGAGTVFELHAEPMGNWEEKVLYSFGGGRDGGNPTSTLAFDTLRDLVGTTSNGGSTCGCGVVFSLDPAKQLEMVLHRFGGSGDGEFPYYGVLIDNAGEMFLSTASGGAESQGAAVELSP
jgi:uncharacterized repeat protein (TIGR03803 family)